MNSKILRWSAIIFMLSIGMIHLYLAPEEYQEAAYMGSLFAVNFICSAIASVGIRRQQNWGWVLGMLVAGGSIYGYILARTVGMPGMEVEEWLNPLGIAALLLEAGFMAVALIARPWGELTGRRRYFAPLAYLAAVLVFGVFSYLGGEAHASVAEHLAKAQPISESALLEQYGVQVRLVGVSMLGSIVDFRLKIIDAEKAATLLENPDTMPMLVVEGSQVELNAPHGHRHSPLRSGTVFYMFFPNTGNVVRGGTPVTIMFGNLRLQGAIPAQ